MRGIRIVMLALAMGALTGCTSHIVVKKLNVASGLPSLKATNGVIYALPKTVVRVSLKVDETKANPAPFGRYAAIFAPGMKAVCQGNECTNPISAAYELEDGVTLSTYGIPDMQRVYSVEFQGGTATDQNIALTWNEAGLLSTANATVTNRTGDIVISSIGAAAGIAAKVLAGGGGGDPNKPPFAMGTKCHSVTSEEDLDRDAEYSNAIIATRLDDSTKEALLQNYCSLKSEERMKIDFDKELFTKALKAYQTRIEPLVGSLGNLYSGQSQALSPSELIDKVATEMNARLTTLYLGTKSVSTWNGTLDVDDIPTTIDESNGDDFPLMWFTPNGICIPKTRLAPDSAKLSSFATISPTSSCTGGTPVNLHLSYGPSKNLQLAGRLVDGDSDKEDTSFRYRIPMQVSAAVIYKDSSQGGAKFFVAQLGTVASLPATRHSKSLSYNLALIEATGGLKSFTLGTTGSIDAASITALGTAGAGIQDARNTAAAAAKTASDAAATAVDPALTKQDSTLKIQDDICTIQKKYNLPCTVQPAQ